MPVVGPLNTFQCHSNQPFIIEPCPCSTQVIHIRSAEVGFTKQCSSSQQACSSPTNHSSVMKCNGQRSCRINQNVLDYLPAHNLCDRSQYARLGFINIVYNCIYSEY